MKNKIFMIILIVGPSSFKRSLKRKQGIESSSHYLFCEEKMRLWIAVEVDGMKLAGFGGGVIGHWEGSEESDGGNTFRKYAFNLLIKNVKRRIGKWLCSKFVRR